MSVSSRAARGSAGSSPGSLNALIVGLVVTAGLLIAPQVAGATPALSETAVVASRTATLVTLSAGSQPLHAATTIRVRAQVVAGNGHPTGTVVFKSDGHTFGTTKVESNGKAVLPLPSALAIGKHRITVTYVPTGASFSTSYGVAYAVVTKAVPTIKLALPGTGPAYGTMSKAKITVTVAGKPVGAGSVALVEDGRTIATGHLDKSGQATLPFTISMRPGKKYMSARFGGTPSVAAGSKVGSFNVSRAPSRTSVNTRNITAGAATQVSVEVSGTLRTPTGTTTTKVAGRTYSRALQSGRSGVSVSGLATGSYPVASSYSGDPWYRPSADTGSVSVSSSPCPATARVCVDLTNSVAWIQSGGRITYGPVPITSGRPGYRTESGTFAVYWKDKDHKSSVFNDAPMPNSVFFDGGNAFHEGSLYVPSHGCIHLSWAASEYFYSTLDYGDTVVVFGYAPY